MSDSLTTITVAPERDATPIPTELLDVWDSRWGGFIAGQQRGNTPTGRVRVVVFGSCAAGNTILRHLAARDDVAVVGVATDELFDRRALIFRRKRLWNDLTEDECRRYQLETEALASEQGVDLFSGEVKTKVFREIFQRWKPDLVVSCVFGQLIPPWVFEAPSLGAYNFHPTDLTKKSGFVGPNPVIPAKAAGLSYIPFTCHWLDAHFDTGHVVGVGTRTPILDEHGTLLPMTKLVKAVVPAIKTLISRLVDVVLAKGSPVLTVDFDSHEQSTQAQS